MLQGPNLKMRIDSELTRFGLLRCGYIRAAGSRCTMAFIFHVSYSLDTCLCASSERRRQQAHGWVTVQTAGPAGRRVAAH